MSYLLFKRVLNSILKCFIYASVSLKLTDKNLFFNNSSIVDLKRIRLVMIRIVTRGFISNFVYSIFNIGLKSFTVF